MANHALPPQEALKRLLQADKEAKEQFQQAKTQAEQIVNEAREKADSLVEEARSQAEAEAETLIKKAQSEASAQEELLVQDQAPGTGKHKAYLTDIEALRRQAEPNLDASIDLLIAWVCGEQV